MSQREREPFGNLQGRKLLEGRPDSRGNRYPCGVCDERFMSDEALQIHRQNHAFVAIAGELGRIIEKLEELKSVLTARERK